VSLLVWCRWPQDIFWAHLILGAILCTTSALATLQEWGLCMQRILRTCTILCIFSGLEPLSNKAHDTAQADATAPVLQRLPLAHGQRNKAEGAAPHWQQLPHGRRRQVPHLRRRKVEVWRPPAQKLMVSIRYIAPVHSVARAQIRWRQTRTCAVRRISAPGLTVDCADDCSVSGGWSSTHDVLVSIRIEIFVLSIAQPNQGFVTSACKCGQMQCSARTSVDPDHTARRTPSRMCATDSRGRGARGTAQKLPCSAHLHAAQQLLHCMHQPPAVPLPPVACM
jgi:hypothetical protein